MPKINKYSSDSWKVLKTPEEIKHIHALMEEYQIWEPTDTSIFLKFGYKNISTGDKETYYTLKDLAAISQKKTKQAKCMVSHDYLALALGTSAECQRLRIDRLKNTELITTIVHQHKASNIYYVNMEPLPDTTFVDTMYKLITRKQVNNLYNLIEHTNNVAEKLACMQEIKELDPTGLYKRKSVAHLVDEPNISAEAILEHFYPENIFAN